jgi:uncharacterized membrane protein YraQ (UPF0718 family)
MTVFIKKDTAIKYLGAGANRIIAYGVASVSGSFLAVCSCTILPLFAGIYRMGAGLGPATAFLYAGPAINILAIILTAKVLGLEIGIARAVGAVLFSIVIGLVMARIYKNEEIERTEGMTQTVSDDKTGALLKNALFFAVMVGILVFANWGRPQEDAGVWHLIFTYKWVITALLSASLGVILVAWFSLPWWKVLLFALPPVFTALIFPGHPLFPFTLGIIGLSLLLATGGGDASLWFSSTWDFTKQIVPLLFAGVFVAGMLLGRPGHEALIPPHWIADAVGGNSLLANLFASVAGAFMYFATLTEVPILEGLLGAGMGKGPALALLLAGPAVSLPNMLVIQSIMGTKKTFVYIILVILMSSLVGMIYGTLFG